MEIHEYYSTTLPAALARRAAGCRSSAGAAPPACLLRPEDPSHKNSASSMAWHRCSEAIWCAKERINCRIENAGQFPFQPAHSVKTSRIRTFAQLLFLVDVLENSSRRQMLEQLNQEADGLVCRCAT